MFDTNVDDDRGSSTAFLDGSASPEAGHLSIARRRQRSQSPKRVALTDPAAKVMTDFTWDTPVTAPVDRFIDDALRDMMVAGVRALLVMRGEVVVGLITSYDIQGERPLQFLNGSGLTRHGEIEVGHIMTAWNEVSAVDLPWVSSATVAEVAERFRRKGDSHFVVVEYADQGGAFVRGMISRAELERRLQQAV
jgi:CBS domain containing-hemolysin-like protein